MKFMKLGSKPDSFKRDGRNTRYVTTELATDFNVNVGDVKFYLHKFPLLSKSGRLQKLVASSNQETQDIVHIPDIPGGASAFELCAKFCYGMTVTLNAYNVAAARCAAEYLEMHESLEKGNLIYKIEVFLNTTIFRTWKDSIIVLQATKPLFPWSEELNVVTRCVDGISSKASIDPSKVDWSYSYNRKKHSFENDPDSQWNGVQRHLVVPKDWWIEDLCDLEIDFYKRVIVAVKSKGIISSQLVGEALKAYALRRLPAFGKDQIHGSEATRKRSLVETIIWLLPSEKGSVSCTFLLKILKAGILLEMSEMAKRELVKRIGLQLDEACASDLLMPAAPSDENGMYDVNLVQNIIHEFLIQEQNTRTGHPMVHNEVLPDNGTTSRSVSYASKLAVAKVVDGYLAEIAHDPNLPLSKFVEIAGMIPDAARPCHDGIYKAIDAYLKEHAGITKSEKKKLCGLMDCKKLSAEASMHAAQNDRLPLRVVVQVLFFEQVRAGGTAGNLGTMDGAIQTLLPPGISGSHGSSRSVATNNEDDWDGTVVTSDELRSIKGEFTSMRIGRNEGNDGDGKDADKVSKVRGVLRSRNMFNKLWANRDKGDNSSSDTSESPSSINPADTKSTASRKGRNSVS